MGLEDFETLKMLRGVLLNGESYPGLERPSISPYYEPRDEDRLAALWELADLTGYDAQRAAIFLLFWMTYEGGYCGPDSSLLPCDVKFFGFSENTNIGLTLFLSLSAVEEFDEIRVHAIAFYMFIDEQMANEIALLLIQSLDHEEEVETVIDLLECLIESEDLIPLVSVAQQLKNSQVARIREYVTKLLNEDHIKQVANYEIFLKPSRYSDFIHLFRYSLYDQHSLGVEAANTLLLQENLEELSPIVVAAGMMQSVNPQIRSIAHEALSQHDREFADFLHNLN